MGACGERNRFFAVIWTWREETIRIITARRARDGQEKRYRAIYAKQIKAMITLGEDRTNWALTDEVTGARLEDSIRADADEAESEPDWTQAVMGIPPRKDHINIRV